MIEAGGSEIAEDVMIDAIKFGFDSCQDIIKFQEEAVEKFGKEKIVPELYKPSKELEDEIKVFAGEMIKEAMWIADKDERNAAMDIVNEKVYAEFEEKYPENVAEY